MGLKNYLGLPQWLSGIFPSKDTKIRRINSQQAQINKMKQKALRGSGHTEIKVDGNWGPYQEKLWQEYKKEHPEGAHAVFDLAPTPVTLDGDSYANYERAIQLQSNLKNKFPDVKDYSGTTTQDIQITDRYIREIQDSIATRNKNGFYKQEPEMHKRDQDILQRYKKFRGHAGNWSCIKSVTGLYPEVPSISGNYTFKDKASSLGFVSQQTAQPNSIIQHLNENGEIEHAVYNLGDGYVYNTHGFIAPFKNGNQIEPAQFNYRRYQENDDGTINYSQWENKTENFYDPKQNQFWRRK